MGPTSRPPVLVSRSLIPPPPPLPPPPYKRRRRNSQRRRLAAMQCAFLIKVHSGESTEMLYDLDDTWEAFCARAAILLGIRDTWNRFVYNGQELQVWNESTLGEICNTFGFFDEGTPIWVIELTRERFAAQEIRRALRGIFSALQTENEGEARRAELLEDARHLERMLSELELSRDASPMTLPHSPAAVTDSD